VEPREPLVAISDDDVAAARAAWPKIDVDLAAFVRFLAERAGDQPTESLRVPDLYLVFACLAGHPAAVAELDAMCAEEIERARPRVGYLSHDAEDIAQRVKERLLVGSGAPPKLVEYAGTGSLQAWLRVTLTRALLNVATRESREVPEDLPFFEALADGVAGPEAELLRASCRAELRQSLEAAAQKLSDRERALLRFAFRDRKTVEQIGAVYGVHGATASRWVQKARQTLVTAVRDDLRARLKISDTEAASVLRGALSQIETSLHRILRTNPG
jgi:RNA polymerase sigma-70 factor (ECF subfamily)